MRVAHALASKQTAEFAKPGKLVEVRFVKGQSLSLTASRLLALMILTAGGDAWRDVPHRMRKADIRRGHKGNERISDMLEELHRTLFAEDDRSWRGRKATRRFSLIQMSKEEAEDEEGGESGWIEWEFTPDARKLIQESETYAVLNRQAVLGFRSSYALKLYEIGALRIHRRQPTWRCDITALRAALGIAPDVYKDFAQLRRKVLQTAKSEIDQLAHFRVEWKETRQGRAVAEVEFRFEAKDAPAQIGTVDELERHSAGRRARREGTVETVRADGELAGEKRKIRLPVAVTPKEAVDRVGSPDVAPSAERASAVSDIVRHAAGRMRSADAERPRVKFASFPSGSLRWSGAEEFLSIGRSHGGGWDVDLIAEAYRGHMGDRLVKLSGVKLQRSWQGFCESYVTRKGRPG
ncbi:replication initiation protein [Sphingomonas beigongshangi]|uniref:replication initiation protein n=1 Tax=Sphingomonas beigongshangi TaxID=2782540 RepID=UPI001AEEB5E6